MKKLALYSLVSAVMLMGARVHVLTFNAGSVITDSQLEAARQASFNHDEHLHFSAFYGISKNTFLEIRKLLEHSLVDSEKLVGPSPEEVLVGLSLDLWRY